MAGSPRYLELLDTLYDFPHNQIMRDDFAILDERWEHVVANPDVENFKGLARAAFYLLAYGTNTTLEFILSEANSLHVKKNAGYAGADNPDPWANFRLSMDCGVVPWRGAWVRMSDKVMRVRNLRKNPDNEQVGESIWETLRDLGAYCLIIVCLLEEDQIPSTVKVQHHPV
jgi:hypothetical protein